MATTENQYWKIISKSRLLFERKMKDYGSAWRILRMSSLTDQIFIKAQRIRSIQTNIDQKINEGVNSEFIGIINYSIMALIQIEKGIVEQPDINISESLNLYDQKIRLTYDLMLKKNHDYY